jgi:transposase
MAMSAHVVYTHIDPTAPATLSKIVIDDIVRGHIGFDGLLMTDDLSMKALSGSFRQRAENAIGAGCDIVLHCNGDLAEARPVAEGAPPLEGAALARAERRPMRAGPRPFDVGRRRASSTRRPLLISVDEMVALLYRTGQPSSRQIPAHLKLPRSGETREDSRLSSAAARRSKDVNQSRRLLSLAAVRDGKDRGEAARIGGMDRQTLRDWVHRFNAAGLEGLVNHWTDGPKPRLSAAQLFELAKIVETGPDRERDGVVRWRRVDLKRVIAEKFGVEFHERYVGTLLKKLGFSHISEWPRHPAQDGDRRGL